MHNIGNFTSQYFANIYLNELDHYVKEELQIKCYIRYMDDFIIMIPSKEEAKKVQTEIANYLASHLNLTLNTKSRYFSHKFGIDFCGFRIYETHKLLRKRFKKKINKSIKLWYMLKSKNKFYDKKFLLSLNSYRGHAVHCNSYHFMQKITEKIQDLYLKEK